MTMSSSKSKHRGGLRSSSTTPSPSSSAAAAAPPPQRAAPALLFSVREVDTQDGDFGATLWLPQASMLAASLSASQLVSVSVCHYLCSENAESLEVEDLEERCTRHFNIVVKGSLGGGAGRHCAIASAWPCRKLKEGVRISKQLACALGCLQPSAQVCVSPITGSGLDSCCKGVKVGTTSAKEVCVQDCQELVLTYCPVGLVDDLAIAFSSLQLAESTPEDLALEKDSGTLSPCPIVDQSETPVRKRRDEDSNIRRMPVATLDSKTVFMKGYFGGIWEAKENRALTSVLGGGDSRAAKLLERLGGRLLHGRYLFEGNFVGMTLFGQCCIFRVVDAKGSPGSRVVATGQESPMDAKSRKPGGQVPNLFLVGNKTQIELIVPTENVDGKIPKENGASSPENLAGVSAELPPLPSMRLDYSLLGGLSEQITTLKEIITFSLLQPGRLMSLGLQPPRGVLLHGPPGTGKTSLALASATEAGVKIFHINGPEVISEYFGESEAAIKAVFEAAQAAAPSVVFIDELDAIAPQRAEGSEDLGRRMVATLLTIMDGGQESLRGVLVIAATNRVETIDPALRRPGRFDREIEIGVPSPFERHEILLSLLSRMGHALAGSDIEALAAAAHGFVGADLSFLCNEAAMVALRHHVHKNITTDDIWCSHLNSTNGVLKLSKKSLKITIDDFEEAKTRVRPSAMREVMLEVPKVRWSDVGGQEDIKQQLQEAVEWPQKHMDAFARIGTRPPRGVLLYGPPGCSKTLMARAVATEAGLNFIAVKGPELFTKWVGESEKAVRSLFQRARVAAPSVVFFDELDGLAMSRDAGSDGVSVGDRVMSQLLVEMDGLSSRKGVTVIAATNRPDKIDAALLRPGRFDRLLYVGPPDENARWQIFEIHTRNMPCAEDVDKRWLATQTNGYTGADITSVCRESAMAALEEDLDARVVSMRHFNAALCSVQPSISHVSEYLYAQFSRGMQNMRPMS